MNNRIELRIERQRVFAQGQDFGETGSYERLDGKVWFRVDPLAPAEAENRSLVFFP